MEKLNCWEVMKCGFLPGTKKAKKYGTCIATVEKRLDGVNSGTNGGRACWALIGTLCPEHGIPKKQNTYSQKLKRCIQCKFYELVAVQEGADFKNTREIVDILESQ